MGHHDGAQQVHGIDPPVEHGLDLGDELDPGPYQLEEDQVKS